MNWIFPSRFQFLKQPISQLGMAAIVAGSILFTGCGELAGVVRNKLTTHGGGQAVAIGPRRANPGDVVAPPGYRVELVAKGLTYPTGIIFDDQNQLYVVESGYAYVEHYATPRLVRIGPDGRKEVIAAGERRHAPWTGGDFHGGAFYISEGGNPGRVSRVTMNGRVTPIVDGLPSKGDHHTDRAVAGPDGWIYFGQGALTNSAVVGEDNAIFGWLIPHPEMHDIPAHDIVLTGQNFNSQDPRVPLPIARRTTGAFVPYGTRTSPGEVIKGHVPATAAIMRVRPEGGPVQLVAWGIRNPFGLAVGPGGRLYAVENGYDARGSRPIDNAEDFLWRIQPGRWYGFPDFVGGVPVTDPRFKPKNGPQPRFLMAQHPPVAHPIAGLGSHTASVGFDFSRSSAFGFSGEAFVAQLGDATPATGTVKAPKGFKVVRVNTGSGAVQDFLTNRRPGPASKIGGGGLERPIDVKFDRTGQAMYVLDFGIMTVPAAPAPEKRTGVLWRVTKM